MDKAATRKVNADAGARPGTGKVHKALLAEGALAAISTLDGEIRRFHAIETKPWLGDGTGILPCVRFDGYRAKMETYAETRIGLVDDLDRVYPMLRDAAASHMNGLWNPNDYPSPAEVRGKFRFDVVFMPVPCAGDFRAELPAAQAAALAAEVEARVNEAQSAAIGDALAKALVAVNHMIAKLGDYRPSTGKGVKTEGIFRDSLIENVRDLAELLPAFNFAGNPAVNALAARITAELTTHGADSLRDSDNLRTKVAEQAAAIAADMAAFM